MSPQHSNKQTALSEAPLQMTWDYCSDSLTRVLKRRPGTGRTSRGHFADFPPNSLAAGSSRSSNQNQSRASAKENMWSETSKLKSLGLRAFPA